MDLSKPEEAVKLDFTDSEWMSLLDGDAEDSELPTCCANIAQLRNDLMFIVRNGRREGIPSWSLSDIRKHLKWVADGHELKNLPLIQRLVDAVGGLPEEHEPDSMEMIDAP